MKQLTPLFATEKHTAQLLDMSQKDFLKLVKQGALPRPIEIGGLNRLDVEGIKALLSGNAAKPREGLEL